MPAKKTSAKKPTKSDIKIEFSEKFDEIVTAIKENKTCHHHHGGRGEAVYGLGIVGAIFYFFQHMPASSEIPITIIKIIFWPAFVAYRLIERFGL